MTTYILKRKKHNPLECLERMLNKSTLTTQRITHSAIVDVGTKLLTSRADDSKEKQLRELEEALDEAEQRATRELKTALRRLRNEKDEEKKRALQTQKSYYERLAARVEEQRDRAEDERIRELNKRRDEEQEEALQKQWEECEELKRIAIEEACIALTKKLRQDFILEKEKAVAEALKIQKQKFLIREKESIERTRRECEEIARKEAEMVAALHRAEVERLNKKYDALEQRFQMEVKHKKKIISDFRELQDDYKKFMDYTDGKYHSDYMMNLRYTGLRLAQIQIQENSHRDVKELF
ncbi:hypothetical protein FSP39_007391 [Pinctada imbricata]|uniref:Uncharacterized protein n=1 Tax=Pinctada imbricata TaxID=66713 RepID=A0AA89BT75_PINIB|nr:hypothetical protein FSP39_007391 [Pinctada imbricata]